MEISREDAIKILCRVSNQDDPYWDNVTDEWYDEDTDTWPTIYDVFEALGITKVEVERAEGIKQSGTE